MVGDGDRSGGGAQSPLARDTLRESTLKGDNGPEESMEAKFERELERINLDVTIGSPRFVVPADPADPNSPRLELAWGSVTATNSHEGGWDLKQWVHQGKKVDTFQYHVDFQGAKAMLVKRSNERPLVAFSTNVAIHTLPGRKGESSKVFGQVDVSELDLALDLDDEDLVTIVAANTPPHTPASPPASPMLSSTNTGPPSPPGSPQSDDSGISGVPRAVQRLRAHAQSRLSSSWDPSSSRAVPSWILNSRLPLFKIKLRRAGKEVAALDVQGISVDICTKTERIAGEGKLQKPYTYLRGHFESFEASTACPRDGTLRQHTLSLPRLFVRARTRKMHGEFQGDLLDATVDPGSFKVSSDPGLVSSIRWGRVDVVSLQDEDKGGSELLGAVHDTMIAVGAEGEAAEIHLDNLRLASSTHTTEDGERRDTTLHAELPHIPHSLRPVVSGEISLGIQGWTSSDGAAATETLRASIEVLNTNKGTMRGLRFSCEADGAGPTMLVGGLEQVDPSHLCLHRVRLATLHRPKGGHIGEEQLTSQPLERLEVYLDPLNGTQIVAKEARLRLLDAALPVLLSVSGYAGEYVKHCLPRLPEALEEVTGLQLCVD